MSDIFKEKYNDMDYIVAANQYYSLWLGEAGLLDQSFHGVRFIDSPERNQTQSGYPGPIDLYVLCQADRAVFSYGDKLRRRIDGLKAAARAADPLELPRLLEERFPGRVQRNRKYVFQALPRQSGRARPLALSDYPMYRDFFLACNPGCQDADWLYGYFDDMARQRLCWGVLVDGVLASCTDAPEMPYLQDAVQEVGINTRESYRRRGYAREACAACVRQILENGKCPLWSAAAGNTASQHLAEQVGFVKYADVLTLTLAE